MSWIFAELPVIPFALARLKAPFDQFAHYHSVPDPNNRTIVLWNVDTLCSIGIYIQADPPGSARNANWLPTPKAGPFKIYLRLYTPEQKVLDGTWAPPAVQRVK